MRRIVGVVGLVLAAGLVGGGVGSARPSAAASMTTAGPSGASSIPWAAASTWTGNLLVLLDRRHAMAAAVHAAVARAGGRPAGHSVPEIGLITVRPSLGESTASLARRLRTLPGVVSVQRERRYVPRIVPNDPAFSAPNANSSTVQWTLAREGFPDAWNIARGDGALVGVIDTGVDASHPDLSTKIFAAVDEQDPSDARGTAFTDEVGHGTHVASLACAATGNHIGMAGAGYNCRLLVEKTDFSDSSVVAAIIDAAHRGVDALNMSFGPSAGSNGPAPDAEVAALRYAASRKVVLVAAAADSPTTEQGDPANVLQPAGTGPILTAGLGLDVTATDYSGHRASFAGYGSEISIAAYGALKPKLGVLPGLIGGGAEPGIIGAFPANATDLDRPPLPCGCRTTIGGASYAYLQGTSMAAPQVAAVGAMMRRLNPDATLTDVLSALKQSATRPAGAGWTSDVGWGILNADAALEAIRRVDHVPPVSTLTAPGVTLSRRFTVRWSGHDVRRPELIPSGIAAYEVSVRTNGSRPRLLVRTTRHSLTFRGRPGSSYVFSCVAVDRAGNRQRRVVGHTTRVSRRAR